MNKNLPPKRAAKKDWDTWLAYPAIPFDDPRLMRMAHALGVKTDAVHLAFLKLFLWMHSNKIASNETSLTPHELQSVCGLDGFVDAAAKEKLLKIQKKGTVIVCTIRDFVGMFWQRRAQWRKEYEGRAARKKLKINEEEKTKKHKNSGGVSNGVTTGVTGQNSGPLDIREIPNGISSGRDGSCKAAAPSGEEEDAEGVTLAEFKRIMDTANQQQNNDAPTE